MRIFIDDDSLDICPRRRVSDIWRLKQHLLDSRHSLTDDIGSADRVYLFTCGYNRPMESLSIETIRLYGKKFEGKLVVAGCLPQMNPVVLRRHYSGPVLTNRQIRELELRPVPSKDIPVSWGCLGRCAYCVDKRAVGELESRPLEQCRADLRAGLLAGHRSFRIVADDLGAWGRERGCDFIDLLEGLVSIRGAGIPENYALHLLEINPLWLIRCRKRLHVFRSDLFADILIGLQSANNRVLGLMRRDYVIEDVRRVIDEPKRYGRRIGIHLIAGFPSETRLEFMDSIRFITAAGIDHGFIFRYIDARHSGGTGGRPAALPA